MQYINKSRIISAKTSGQFKLLTSEESAAIAVYETELGNYMKAKDFNNSFYKDNMPLLLKFSTMELYHKQIFPNVVFPKYPYYNLSDEDLVAFLKTREIYEKLNLILMSIMLDISWLRRLDSDIDKTIEVLYSSTD